MKSALNIPFSASKTIAERFLTPVFLFWEDLFKENLREFKQAFTLNDRPCFCAYSYKTNSIKALCAIARQEGYGAEVVSPSELDLALKLYRKGSEIIYNGPFKPIDSIGKAVENDVSLHIDSLDELKIVLTSFKTAKKIRIAFRLTPEFGDDASPVWSKFGLSTSNGELNQALQMIKGTNLSLEGLHMHVGTNLTTPDIYGSIAQALTNTACRIRSFLKHELRYIDIGGGFSARSGAVPSMAHPEEWTPISPKAIIKKITPSLDCFDPEKRISVVSEPGRIIAEKAMSLLTRVVSIKKRDRRLQIILDAGTNILPTAYYTRHPICFPGKERETREETADFHGPLCTQYDVIALETAVPKLVPGDLVLIHGAGAYTYSFSSQFVGPRPPVVLVSEERNTFEPIREKEPEDILWKYDRMPNL